MKNRLQSKMAGIEITNIEGLDEGTQEIKWEQRERGRRTRKKHSHKSSYGTEIQEFTREQLVSNEAQSQVRPELREGAEFGK